ncbi:MAG: SMP-30/gluconolactonase/LRE family protein [Pseudomonadota bacterium]
MRLAFIGVVFFGAAALAALGLLQSFGHFAPTVRDFAGKCAPVTGVIGPEDIALDPGSGRVFLSSVDRRDESARGGLHLISLDDPLAETGWRDLTGGEPALFRPLGLDYFENDSVRRLFVVNEATSSVEAFDVGDDGALTHVESFAERRMTSPNNIVAVGPRSFYVTNDARPGRGSLVGQFQFLTRAASGDVLHYDGTGWRVAASGLRFANGIAANADGDRLYVAETSGGAVKIFDRNAQTGALDAVASIALPAAPDNLTLDEDGAIWVAALPKPLATPIVKANPSATAPSAIYRIVGEGPPEAVYRDDGSEISLATAAARRGSKIVIGALFENKFLICDLPRAPF